MPHKPHGAGSSADGLPSPRPGWMNYRVGTRLTIFDEGDAFVVTTTLYGLFQDSVRVWWYDDYLFVEALFIPTDEQIAWRGRYARHLPLPESIDGPALEFAYYADGQLIIWLPKQRSLQVKKRGASA